MMLFQFTKDEWLAKCRKLTSENFAFDEATIKEIKTTNSKLWNMFIARSLDLSNLRPASERHSVCPDNPHSEDQELKKSIIDFYLFVPRRGLNAPPAPENYQQYSIEYLMKDDWVEYDDEVISDPVGYFYELLKSKEFKSDFDVMKSICKDDDLLKKLKLDCFSYEDIVDNLPELTVLRLRELAGDQLTAEELQRKIEWEEFERGLKNRRAQEKATYDRWDD